MAAAGFIPVVGWAGRAAKGGNAVYKTVKGINAADHALDAYKSTKAMDILKQTEAGLYGLTAANGLGEAVTVKDMFGNELTEEQRQTSLMTALGITGIAGAAKAADKMASGTKLIPYSKEYVQNKVQKAKGSIKDMGKAIGKVEVPTGVKVRTVADTTGNTYKNISVDKTTIKDLAQKVTAKNEGSKGTGKNVHRSEIDEVIKNDYDKNGNLINRSIVPKGYDSIEDFLKFVDEETIKEYGYDNIDEFKDVVGHVDDYLNASPKNNIVNKGLAGGKHVKGIDYDVLGFPIFKGEDVKFSLKLEKSLFIATDDKQFKECTRVLKEAIEKGDVSKDLFTPKNLAQIYAEKSRIQGLTWHHHQVPGKMQLVISKVHDVNHLGGNKLWGDGIR